jgi:hypothetical protein
MGVDLVRIRDGAGQEIVFVTSSQLARLYRHASPRQSMPPKVLGESCWDDVDHRSEFHTQGMGDAEWQWIASFFF